MKRTYNEHIADQVREMLSHHGNLVEKEMFNGLCFMLNDKMCVCVTSEELLCRIGAEQVAKELEAGTCRQMMMNGRSSKDFVYADLEEIANRRNLRHWVQLCLDFHPQAKSSKKVKHKKEG